MSGFRPAIYGICSNFTKFGKGFLNPSLYLPMRGRGLRCHASAFNRKRVKLKKLLGIRARLALLAVILVAPLMLERVRSLEDTRSRQIAQASEEYANLTQHSADTQREVISSVETMLKSTAYIRASGGIGRSCEILRASLPSNLPWIRSIMIVGRDGVVQCSTLNMHSRTQPRRPRLFQEGAANPRFRFQRLSVRQDQQSADDDGRLSGRRHQP